MLVHAPSSGQRPERTPHWTQSQVLRTEQDKRKTSDLQLSKASYKIDKDKRKQ